MAEIININRARKERVRAEAKANAEANRAKFGRTKAQKIADREEAERRERTLDGAKRED